MPSSRPLALLIFILVVVIIRPVHGATAENQQSKSIAGQVSGDIQAIAGDYIALNRANTQGDALPNRSAEALATLHEAQDGLLKRIHAIDPNKLTGSSVTAYAILLENLESLQAVRACRNELWDINHITGWQVGLPPQAASQSVKTASERERALRRWSLLAGFIDTDVANLRTGMAKGYLVPKTVVGRVLRQVDGLINSGDESPFAEPEKKRTTPNSGQRGAFCYCRR